MSVRATRSVSESAGEPVAAGAGVIDACRRRLPKERSPRASRVTHVLLLLGIAAVCNASSVFAQRPPSRSPLMIRGKTRISPNGSGERGCAISGLPSRAAKSTSARAT